MSDTLHRKLVIIGSGPAGYTAAIYASRAMLKPMLIQGMQPGGQLTITTDVENYPGFAEVIQGPWLMAQMEAQAKEMETEILTDHVKTVDVSSRPFKIETEGGKHITADSLVICTGAQAKWLGLESETKFQGFGVSACATCDGFFYKDKHVIVIGGGNTAVEEALFLTNFASKVTLVHRRDALRCEKILERRLLAHDKIEVMWDTALEEVLGTDQPLGVTGAKLKNTKTGDITKVDVDGIFVAIGHAPATELFKTQVKLTDTGYIETVAGSARTNIPFVYAAGDVTDETYRQAVTAAGMGCMAALEAEHDLANDEA